MSLRRLLRLLPVVPVALAGVSLHAQTIDDGLKIGLPNFPAYSSGHSTFSASATVVLSYLFPSGASSFAAMRDEAAISRLYGAIHYRSDIEVGKTHGERIGGYTVAFARTDEAD